MKKADSNQYYSEGHVGVGTGRADMAYQWGRLRLLTNHHNILQ